MTSGCVFFMVGLGGYTRLTKSGLSMTTWKPLSIHYPTNDAQWQEEFEAYKDFPEYHRHNQNMSLESFKSIYFYEYFHRLVGRGIGMVFGIPLAYFWLRGYLLNPMKWRCLLLFGMGGLQGFVVKFFLLCSFFGIFHSIFIKLMNNSKNIHFCFKITFLKNSLI